MKINILIIAAIILVAGVLIYLYWLKNNIKPIHLIGPSSLMPSGSENQNASISLSSQLS